MNCMDQVITDQYAAYHGDAVEVFKGLPDRSVGYSIFSPPFASLYVYSNSPRDMGNVRSDEEFFEHFEFLIPELKRVLKPGRNVSFHCMLMPSSKTRDGVIGLKDFRGDLIRAFQGHEAAELHAAMLHLQRRADRALLAGDAARASRLDGVWQVMQEDLQAHPANDYGFTFHSEVVIWKDPVTAMQRTKALGLLHKTVRENAAMSRQGIPDYLVTMRAPGESDRVIHYRDDDELWSKVPQPTALDRSQIYSVDQWQKVASPVWMDIDPSDTLQYRSARDHDDERHIAPLQLEVIRRGIALWSNPGDVVATPFGGIGSEGYLAVEMGRRAVLAELKASYFKQLTANMAAAVSAKQGGLFAALEAEEEAEAA